MGPYCRYCDHRCFVERRMPDDAKVMAGQVVNLATCPAGADHDREAVGFDYTTAIWPRPLACPNCGGRDNLWSDEPASIMYPIKLWRRGDELTPEYTGEDYSPCDEGTTYVGDIWCRHCSTQLTEADFGIERETPAPAANLASLATLWVELVAVHGSSSQHPTLERRQMARSYRNGMVAAYARITGQDEETVIEELDAASVAAHEIALQEATS